jgi:outer membrane protein assembly factor BamD (BamD/ComL family)
MGDYEQQKTLNYEQAVVYYDSSYSSLNYCDWAQKSRALSEALKRLIAMRNMNDSLSKDSVPNLDNFFGTEFQIAELFLFKLDQVDSAVNRLTGIIENSNDSARVMLATYARAFIYDEYKGDEDTAEELYKEIIEKYPGTEYAKQAQANLGMRVTIKTRDDEAKERYLQAESLWTVASEVPLDQMEQVDSAYATAFAAFDSLYRDYPDTESGVQALYMKFVYFQMDPERGDSVGVVLNELRSKHRDTPWGKYAAKVLDHRLAITDSEIERLRRRVQQSIEHIDQMSAQYHESINKKPEEKKAEVKSKEDEILENSYNSMYDFE